MKVLKSATHATNFLELRAEIFHHAKGRSHNNLPPTTQGLTPHIKSSFFNAYNIMHIFDLHHDQQRAMAVKAEDCGFKYDKGELTPETSWKTLEPHWTVVCSCRKCARMTCPCRVANVKCVN